MNMNENLAPDFTRRDFLKGGSMATLMTMLGGVELVAPTARAADIDKLIAFQVKVGVIGLGPWGRDQILNSLARIKEAQIVAVCDHYPASLRKGSAVIPSAEAVSDYRKVLDNKDIQAVIVATPSHQHKEIVLAALQAGKHVYCEAPLASSLQDTQEIAQAARNAKKQVFQAGLQQRSEPQRHFLLSFIRSGAMGKNIMARGQWNKKQQWRFPSPNPEREREINWRLRKESSSGLIGEVGIHQLDAASWYLGALPVAVTGFGSIAQWDDGRDVADTARTVVEYPGGVTLTYDATIANSFDSEYEIYYGTDAAVMVRGTKAWLFKEVDSPMLGWEVYARKDIFYQETGIALVANATKSTKQEPKPGEESPYAFTSLYYALESFLNNCNEVGTGVEDFNASFDPKDIKGLEKFLAGLKRTHAAGYKEGYEATIVALLANEAVVKGRRVAIEKGLYTLA